MNPALTVLHVLNERGRRHHWTIRAAKWLVLISLGAMGVAASTANSDHHLQADGTKAPKEDRPEGDPGGKPTDDVGQKTDAGEKTDPDSESNELDESGTGSR